MGDSLIKDLAELAGATDPINGSWLVAFADQMGVTSTVNCSWWEAIGIELGLTPVNGSWIQAIAESYGATDPVNGSWLQALYDNISFGDPDAQAFITAASITDPTQISALNQLVVDLKGYSLWTKMKAVYPFVGGSASSHKWNLKDPRDLDAAFRLSFTGGWTHSSTGAKPNGTNAFASTFIVANTLSQNSTHLSTYLRDNSFGSEIDISTSAYDLYLGARYSSFGYIGNIHNGELNTLGSTDSRGLNVTSRILSTSYKHYKNGIALGTCTVSSTTPSANTVVIGKGAPDWSTRETAFTSIGDGLSDTDVSNLYTAVQAFQTTLGRNV